MTSKTYGKRFSKETVTPLISSNASPEEMRKFSELMKDTLPTDWRTFDNIILYWSERAVEILNEKNLPYTASLYWLAGSDQWQADRPTDTIFFKSSLLSHHVIKELGYGHDSTEGIAARMITIISRLEKADPNDDLLLLAYEFGQINTLFNAYSIESNTGASGGRVSGKKQCWIDLAEFLVSEFDGYKNTELLKCIPLTKKPEFPNYYRSTSVNGVDLVHHYKEGKPDVEFQWDSFRKGYIPDAKNSNQPSKFPKK